MTSLSQQLGQCDHADAVPVTSCITEEAVAGLCPACGIQLPAEWFGCAHDETISIDELGKLPGQRICQGCGGYFWRAPSSTESPFPLEWL
jgi:hypothetical protein